MKRVRIETKRNTDVKPVGGRRLLAAPLADRVSAAGELEFENERLRFLVETLDAERLVLEARLGTLREMLRARCDEADALRRKLEEVAN